jgi:1-deoxy-D-xylulose 5-phosphate reductoisomerase
MERRIDFSEIESVVAEAVSKLQGPEPSSFEDLQHIDQESREFVKRIVQL